MYQLKLISGERFTITEQEMRDLSGKSGLQPIASLKGFVNISSISSILPSELANKTDSTKRTLYNGTRVINKFGTWYLENNQDVKVDLNYYTELKEAAEVEDSDKTLPASGFAKELSNKI